jgi:hypothetical protein
MESLFVNCHGYRDNVRKIMHSLDPEGVQERSWRRLRRRVYHNKGPNYLWHMDGYDKLSPYGICIHGCVDGFSRKIIWLKVTPTNHNPRVILRFFLDAVKENSGCPTVIRSDHGTENGDVATAQIALRLHHTDSLSGDKSFIYGSSPSNIRIEAWWSVFRRLKMSWWIEICKGIAMSGEFDKSNRMHRYCLAFVIVPILQKELDDFVKWWNSHRIRYNRKSDSPKGIPDDLFDIPEAVGCINWKKAYNSSTWDCLYDDSCSVPPFFDEEFQREADAYLKCMYGINILTDEVPASECIYVYKKLLELFD